MQGPRSLDFKSKWLTAGPGTPRGSQRSQAKMVAVVAISGTSPNSGQERSTAIVVIAV